MKALRALFLLPLVAALALLASCNSDPPDNTGVVQVRDMLLTYITPTEATNALQNKIGGGATVSPNARNNSVIVTGTMAQIRKAEELLKQVDVPKK